MGDSTGPTLVSKTPSGVGESASDKPTISLVFNEDIQVGSNGEVTFSSAGQPPISLTVPGNVNTGSCVGTGADQYAKLTITQSTFTIDFHSSCGTALRPSTTYYVSFP